VDAKRFQKLREEYLGRPLEWDHVNADPLAQISTWIEEAVEADIGLANAMTLATSVDGKPSSRVVLLKGLDERGLVFFSNYASRKGRELEQNPNAALQFWWGPLARQIRIEGVVSRIDASESDAYFASRPRESNLSAMASAQSCVVASRTELEEAVVALTREWEGRELVRPEGWGGYRLDPHTVELWQGRPDRLHDRLRYTRQSDGGWRHDRLSP
jgi:pyridoxamine 5'-phosphate oxidase